MAKPSCTIEALDVAGLDRHLDALADILRACVHHGASVNFILPFGIPESRAFWLDRVRPALAAKTRTVFVAHTDGQIAGTVQLDYDTPPNQVHRADIAKLLVHPTFRRRGIARALMIAAEDEARRIDRSLLTLDTAGDEALALYLSQGYAIAGVIPGHARNPVEDRLDDTTYMYKML